MRRLLRANGESSFGFKSADLCTQFAFGLSSLTGRKTIVPRYPEGPSALTRLTREPSDAANARKPCHEIKCPENPGDRAFLTSLARSRLGSLSAGPSYRLRSPPLPQQVSGRRPQGRDDVAVDQDHASYATFRRRRLKRPHDVGDHTSARSAERHQRTSSGRMLRSRSRSRADFVSIYQPIF
jgi:hypothetical protein